MNRALVALLLTCSCGGTSVTAPRGPRAEAWTYIFRLDGTLTRLEAEVCFEGEMPAELAPIDRSGRRYLRSAHGPVGPEEAPLPLTDTLVVTEHLPPDSCVRYVVDLEAAARDRGGIGGAYRIGDDLIASTAVWLWAPRNRAPDARVTARFEVPDDLVLSPLWARSGDRWFLDERAFEFVAYAAFGHFEVRHIGVPGACLHVSLLGHPVEMGPDALTRCLTESATAASLLFGRFPVEEAGVLAVPTPLSSTSPFGIVGRGTMPTIAILVGDRATPERLRGAWVPVHEFSHLATPFIERDDAWLSEGIATYYQEVLRARGNLHTPEEAWTNLHRGFARGRLAGTGRDLVDESREMSETGAYSRVYWAGAAIALIADVQMRLRSNGAHSLDDAVEHLNECCGEWDRQMTGSEAIARLGVIEDGAFGQVARRHLGESAFPGLEVTYRRLGLVPLGESDLSFTDDADAATLREAIMSAPEQVSPIPPCGPWHVMP